MYLLAVYFIHGSAIRVCGFIARAMLHIRSLRRLRHAVPRFVETLPCGGTGAAAPDISYNTILFIMYLYLLFYKFCYFACFTWSVICTDAKKIPEIFVHNRHSTYICAKFLIIHLKTQIYG